MDHCTDPRLLCALCFLRGLLPRRAIPSTQPKTKTGRRKAEKTSRARSRARERARREQCRNCCEITRRRPGGSPRLASVVTRRANALLPHFRTRLARLSSTCRPSFVIVTVYGVRSLSHQLGGAEMRRACLSRESFRLLIATIHRLSRVIISQPNISRLVLLREPRPRALIRRVRRGRNSSRLVVPVRLVSFRVLDHRFTLPVPKSVPRITDLMTV